MRLRLGDFVRLWLLLVIKFPTSWFASRLPHQRKICNPIYSLPYHIALHNTPQGQVHVFITIFAPKLVSLAHSLWHTVTFTKSSELRFFLLFMSFFYRTSVPSTRGKQVCKQHMKTSRVQMGWKSKSLLHCTCD